MFLISHPPLALAVALSVAALGAALPAAAQPTPSAAREVVQSADQLPRRTVKLAKLPSQYLEAPPAEVLALAMALEANLRADLARYDIRDAATLRSYYSGLLVVAQFKGDWAAVPALVDELRKLQDKPGPRATSGLLSLVIGEQRAGAKGADWVQAEVEKRFGALSWTDAGDSIKGLKSQMELLNPAMVKGLFEQQLDTQARNMAMTVPESLVASIVGARVQFEQLAPMRGAIVAGLQRVVDKQAVAVAKPDIWTPRQFTIAADAKATPVAVAVWDSGVDLALFKATPGRGLSVEDDGRISNSLLRPLGDAQARWPELKQRVKGAMDLRAALDTEDARRLKQTVASLKSDQAKGFQEDMSLVSMYTHGTHVAGITVDGNPFARVFSAAMLWDHRMEPGKPDEARSRRWADAYRQTVAAMKAQGVRVVNMSWRYGARAYEGALAFHNIGRDAEDRQRIAKQLFAVERDALREAIASAPEILFVAGSGNEDNSADFEEYIPAGFSLPNLITVGAVDKAGDETSFSTFGKTVVVHANGFEVESFLPGGDRVRFSGTSMASPQVANLAAKLFALKPTLSVAAVKDAILQGVDTRGRVRLANPRKSAELLGLKV